MIYQDYFDPLVLRRYVLRINWRAKQIRAVGRLTVYEVRERIFESRGRCEWCGADLVHKEFELDHVFSLGQQGRNTPDNLVVSCPECNRRKAGKHPARFAAEIYSETGHMTALISAIMRDFDMTPKAQQSLFEEDSTEPPPTTIERDDEPPPPPPYRWA
jgi:hypothetical protein